MKRVLFRVMIIWLISPAIFFNYSHAQELTVHGEFIQDSVKIGEELTYSLTARYPSKLNLVFPDSTGSFSTFEFARKRCVPTVTKDSISYDSVIYYLRTFATDSLQKLSLPVYVIHTADCTLVQAHTDSIALQSVVGAALDTMSLNALPLKEHLAYQPVPMQFNYIMALLIAGIVIAAGMAGWLFFGTPIQRHFVMKRLSRRHAQFLARYRQSLDQLQSGMSAPHAEATITVWKKYMENLERIPFTKLTTRETIRLVEDDALTVNLHAIDRAIYGNQQITLSPFEGLQVFAEEKFKKKLEEVKHG